MPFLPFYSFIPEIFRNFAKKEKLMNPTCYKILQILIWLIGFIFVAAISYICYTLGTSLK